MGLRANGQNRFLKMFLVSKGGFILAWGRDPWAGRGALLLCEAGGYMLRAQGGRDVQRVLDRKCLLRASTRRTTFASFL